MRPFTILLRPLRPGQPVRRPVRRTRTERGSATVFVIGFSMVLLLAAGLAIDGGLAINKRMRVADDAEQAARVGANAIDVAALRSGQGIVIDPTLARSQAADYLRGLGYGGAGSSFVVNPGADRVEVVIRARSKTYFLDLFGVTFPVRASAVSSPETGP